MSILLLPYTIRLKRSAIWNPALLPALEATQGQMDGFFSQLPYKCHQNRVAYVGY